MGNFVVSGTAGGRIRVPAVDPKPGHERIEILGILFCISSREKIAVELASEIISEGDLLGLHNPPTCVPKYKDARIHVSCRSR
jgi:hypothetical protein